MVPLHRLQPAFAVLGALWAVRWPEVMWADLPIVAWGAVVESTG